LSSLQNTRQRFAIRRPEFENVHAFYPVGAWLQGGARPAPQTAEAGIAEPVRLDATAAAAILRKRLPQTIRRWHLRLAFRTCRIESTIDKKAGLRI
jgi:hypothetical protein